MAMDMHTIATELAPEPSVLITAALSPIQSIEGALFGLAAAAAVAAVLVAMVRGVLFNSDSTNAATCARIIRILLMCALVGSMASVLSWAYQALVVGSGMGIQGMTTIQGGF